MTQPPVQLTVGRGGGMVWPGTTLYTPASAPVEDTPQSSTSRKESLADREKCISVGPSHSPGRKFVAAAAAVPPPLPPKLLTFWGNTCIYFASIGN